MARGFKIADAYVEVTVDKDAIKDGVKGIPGSVGPDLDRSGKDMGKRLGKSLGDESKRQGDDAGSKLAVGMRMSLIRNSPLIVAAAAGALAVGAPAMLAAATGLFAGIGIAAAAQNDEVKAAFAGLRDLAKNSAHEIGQPLADILPTIADSIGGAFERMKPQIIGAMRAVAPQVAVFTKGVTDLAENALPGMVRAVQAGMPVTQGFADFLAKIGTGLSDFFDRLTAHAPAAGSAFSSLGDSFAALLPTLGELLGQGAELASVMLPLLSGALSTVLGVVSTLGPALPALATGFAAFRIVSALNGPLSSFGTTLGNLAAKNIPLVSTAAGGAATAIGRMGSAIPFVGIAVAGLSSAFEANQQKINNWSRAILDGGAAATTAYQQMGNPSFWDEFNYNLTHWGNTTSVAAAQQRDAEKAAKELFNSLSPLGQAQQTVTEKTNALEEVTGRLGPTARQTKVASKELEVAQGELAAQQGALETAMHGVTQAMIDQANQAMGSINADFAYQDALDALEDKQRALADAIRDHGKASEEASDAQRDYAEGIWDTAQKAAAASPILDGLEQGTAEYDRAVQNLTLKSLVDMRAGLGPEMQAAVDQMIATLRAGGASLDELGDKKPKPTVDANIDPLISKSQTGQQIIDDLDGRRPLPGLDLNTGPFDGKSQWSFGVLDLLGIQHPTPTAYLNAGPMAATVNAMHGVMNGLDARVANPWARLHADTSSAEYALNYAARDRYSRVMQTVVGSSIRSTVATGGKIGDVIRGFAGGGSPMRRFDGKLIGPGGPLDDLIPAITNMGEQIRVANEEWVINGAVSQRQGDARMAALNAGQADIVPRRFGRGGGVDERGRGGALGDWTVVINVNGTFDLASSRDLRRAATVIHSELKQIERSLS